VDEIALNDKSQLEQCTLAMYGELDQILLYNKREEAINMQSTEAHMKEKQRREKIEIIFSHRVKGESYFHGSSYQWKNIVYQNYDRIQQKEMEVEQLISKMEKAGVRFTQHRSLIYYPVIDFVKYIAKIYKEPLEIQ
jgi:hypothetical protein